MRDLRGSSSRVLAALTVLLGGCMHAGRPVASTRLAPESSPIAAPSPVAAPVATPAAARLARPDPVGIQDPVERADFERVRDAFARGDYAGARAIVAVWRERYPRAQGWRAGYVWKNLDECLPRNDAPSPIGRAIAADLLGLFEIALEGYVDHIEHGQENVWTSKSNLCTYVARCAIELGRPGLALEYLDMAIARGREQFRPLRQAQADSLRELLAHPDNAQARVRFAVVYWKLSPPPYRSPIPPAIAALQDLLDDAGGGLEPTLHAEVLARLLGLELTAGASTRAAHWARRLARDCAPDSILAALPTDVGPSREHHDFREPRYEVLGKAVELLESAGDYVDAALMLELMLPHGLDWRGGSPTLSTVSHCRFDHLSSLWERAGDLQRAWENQDRARLAPFVPCDPLQSRRHLEGDATRLAELARRLERR